MESYFGHRQKYFQTDFYIQERKKYRILLDKHNKPLGGKWSLDAENRKRYPKGEKAPPVVFPVMNSFYKEAIAYVNQHFRDNSGEISVSFVYPSTHWESEEWLEQFLQNRFHAFGDYEDAMVDGNKTLHQRQQLYFKNEQLPEGPVE